MKRAVNRNGWAALRRVIAACPLLAIGLASAATPHAPTTDADAGFPDLVAALNARYYKTPKACGPNATAPYHCSGIVESIRFGTLDLQDKHYARDAVSFSYLRADVPTRILWGFGVSGVIVNHFEGDDGNHDGYLMRARCLFPTDGATDARPDGCGPVVVAHNPNPPGTSKPCGSQGIRTAEDWVRFHDRILKEGYRHLGCGFGVTADDFRIAIAGQNLTLANGAQSGPIKREWNEIVLGAWPVEEARRLPAEAFFFMPANHPNQYVRELQCDYFLKTGRVVPIVRLHLPDIERVQSAHAVAAADEPLAFSARLSDQAVTEAHPDKAACEAVLAGSDGLYLYQGMSDDEIARARDKVRARFRGEPIPKRLSWLEYQR